MGVMPPIPPPPPPGFGVERYSNTRGRLAERPLVARPAPPPPRKPMGCIAQTGNRPGGTIIGNYKTIAERPKPLEPQQTTRGAFPGAVNAEPFGGFPPGTVRLVRSTVAGPSAPRRLWNWLTGRQSVWTVKSVFEAKAVG